MHNIDFSYRFDEAPAPSACGMVATVGSFPFAQVQARWTLNNKTRFFATRTAITTRKELIVVLTITKSCTNKDHLNRRQCD